MATRKLGRLAADLLLALLNATLILAALCLWLLWGVLGTARDISADIEQTARLILPIRDEIQTLTAEIEAARSALADLQGGMRATAAADLAPVAAELEALRAEIAGLRADLAAFQQAEADQIEAALTAALDRALHLLLAALRRPPPPEPPDA